MTRSLRALLVALVVTTLLPGAAFARVLYACGMTGRVATACCCKAAARHAAEGEKQRETPAKLERPGCCEALPAEVTRTDATVAPDGHVVAAAGLSAVLPIPARLTPPAVTALAELPRARGPPAPSAPLYLENCSLLR